MGEKDALVVVAHPDDETLGMGGTMARLVGEGYTVYVRALTDGVSARPDATSDAAAVRAQEYRDARRVLRAYEVAPAVDARAFPDNRMDAVPLLDVVRAVEAAVNAVQPIVVYTHAAGDLNIDHRITHQAVLTACRPLPGAGVLKIYAFEVPGSTGWGPGAFRPTSYVVLGQEEWDAKRAALACYASEDRAWPHPRSLPAVEALVRLRGSQCGHTAAEAFEDVLEVWP